jgi:hypothetical protein
MAVTLQAGGFILSMLSIYFIFMKLADKVNQRLLFGVSGVMQIGGMMLLALFPLPAAQLVNARNTLTQILQGPAREITARLDLSAMRDGQWRAKAAAHRSCCRSRARR